MNARGQLERLTRVSSPMSGAKWLSRDDVGHGLEQLQTRWRTVSRVGIGAIAVALAMCGVAGCGGDRRPHSVESAGADLRSAADIADHLSTGGRYPFSTSLANELHASDPSTVYEPLVFPAQIPSGSAIGVYATASTVWLSKRGPAGLVIELRRVSRGAAKGTYGPAAITPSAIVNGDFATPVSETWSIQAAGIAQVRRDSHVFAKTSASLRVDGTGRPGRRPTIVYQIPPGLASRAAGSVYTVDLLARSRRLSRPLSVETKIEYGDGSYDFFLARPQGGKGSQAGIPAGSSDGWIPLESRAVARKRVTRLIFYAVDTGLAPLRGSAWIDDVTLGIAKP
jgi:hypothetical protein